MKSRLNYILDMIEKEYDEIWDTCCDHGKLGISLLNNSSVNRVHFVDCIPGIIDKLKSKLYSLGYNNSDRAFVHLMNAEEIRLNSNCRSLICICGVGGETAIDIIKGLLLNNDLSDHDLLLSVQYRIPELRRFLKDSGIKVEREKLCFEGKWPHELLRVSKSSGYEIDLIGTPMFNLNDQQHKTYIDKAIKHYSKKVKTNPEYYDVLSLYQKLVIEML